MRKTGAARRTDEGRDGEHGADAGGHAATAMEAQEDRAPGPDHRGHADQRQDHVRRLEVHGDEDRHGALAAVEQARPRGPRVQPIARSALVPPVRPLPTSRGSTPPVSLATRTPVGMDPMR